MSKVHKFTGLIQIEIEAHDNLKSRLLSTSLALKVSDEMDPDAYAKDGIINKLGSETLTQILVQGLVANIHTAHQRNWRDSAEHLRYIISELERGFIEHASISEGKVT